MNARVAHLYDAAEAQDRQARENIIERLKSGGTASSISLQDVIEAYFTGQDCNYAVNELVEVLCGSGDKDKFTERMIERFLIKRDDIVQDELEQIATEENLG